MPIDEEKCVKCGKCVEVCPITNSQTIRFPRRCIECGQCIAVCPNQARSLPSIEICDPSLLNSRRSVRQYKKDVVPMHAILGIISETLSAPSPHNSMPVKWCIVSEPKLGEIRHQLIDNSPSQFKISAELGNDPFFFHAPYLVIAYTDSDTIFGMESAVIAMTYFELIASKLKFGTCWAGHFMVFGKSLLEPEVTNIAAAVTFGIPKHSYPNAILRKKEIDIIWK